MSPLLLLLLLLLTLMAARPIAGGLANPNGMKASEISLPVLSPSAVSTQDSSSCANSLLSTRISFLPQQNESVLLLKRAEMHRSAICSVYRNKPSCCTAALLGEFAQYSDFVDHNWGTVEYLDVLIKRDAQLAVDWIINAIRQGQDNFQDQAYWREIRDRFRVLGGSILADAWTALFPRIERLFRESVTYQEGLLCSTCEPGFATKFYSPQTRELILHPAQANAWAESMVNVLSAVDAFLSHKPNVDRLRKLAVLLCTTLTQGDKQCMLIETFFNTALNYVTGTALRRMFCTKTNMPNELALANAKCAHYFKTTVLRGLFFDYFVLVKNVAQYITDSCQVGNYCSRILPAAKDWIDRTSVSFDERELVVNVYENDRGFDVHRAACESHLTGYACNGAGPAKYVHDGGEEEGDGGGGLAPGWIVLIVLLCLAPVFLLAYAARQRIKRLSQTLYARMEDGAAGPLVGLV